jgi:hypothetical protein
VDPQEYSVKKAELSKKTVSELRAMAKARGLRGYSAQRKAQLVDALAAKSTEPRRNERKAGSEKDKARAAGERAKASGGRAAKRAGGASRSRKRGPATSSRLSRDETDVESVVGRGLSPRTRRAFSLYRALGEQRVKASKYYLGVHESPEIDEGFMFPETHGENVVILMVRDPYWLFAYWEFSPDLNEELVGRVGEDALARSRLVLRVYDVTGSDIDEDTEYHDIDVAPGARDWYINVTRVERDYRVDIGLLLPDGTFIVIARSNCVSLPPIGPSDEVDERWVTLETLEEVYKLAERGPASGSGGWGSGGWGRG